MTLGRGLVIGFWTVVVILAALTFYQQMKGEHDQPAAEPAQPQPQRVVSGGGPKVEAEGTGGRLEVESYNLIEYEDNETVFRVEITLKNVGDERIKGGSVRVYPYRNSYGLNHTGEINIDQQNSLWQLSQTLPLMPLGPGQSDTLGFDFSHIVDHSPGSGYMPERVIIELR